MICSIIIIRRIIIAVLIIIIIPVAKKLNELRKKYPHLNADLTSYPLESYFRIQFTSNFRILFFSIRITFITLHTEIILLIPLNIIIAATYYFNHYVDIYYLYSILLFHYI